MASPLSKVTAGQGLRIPAEAYNSFIDAANANRSRRPGSGAVPNGPLERRPSIVLIKNSSGNDLPPFSVLGIDSILISPDNDLDQFRSRVMLVGVTPTIANHSDKFAITTQLITNNGVGPAVIDGAICAQVNLVSATDEFAGVADGNTTNLISSMYGGARILATKSPPVSGLQWAYIKLNSRSTLYIIKISSSSQDGSNLRWTYTARIQKQSGSAWSGWADFDGEDVTAYNGIEAPNGSTGALGCGIDTSNIPSGFNLKPIGNGTIVVAKRVVNSSGDAEFWFSATNQVDGTCPDSGD